MAAGFVQEVRAQAWYMGHPISLVLWGNFHTEELMRKRVQKCTKMANGSYHDLPLLDCTLLDTWGRGGEEEILGITLEYSTEFFLCHDKPCEVDLLLKLRKH